MEKLIRIFLGLIVALLAGAALAQQSPPADQEHGDKLILSVSPYVQHLNLKKEYSHVWLVGLEREHPNGKLDGIAFFSNSFNQPSLYFFPLGWAYHSIFDIEPLSFKWTAGLLYGYLGEYKNRVPLNYMGFSPGVSAALAWQITPDWSAQVTWAGNFLMFQINMALK